MSDGKCPGAVSAFRVPMLLLLLAAAPCAGLAQSAPPPGLPPGVYMGEPDYKQAPPAPTRSIPTTPRSSRACRTSATPTASSASIA